MRKTDADPDAHLAALPGEAGDAIRDVDVVIREEMRGLPRVMWEGVFWGGSEQRIIGYGNYTYERRGKSEEWFVVGLASQKNYISIYVSAVEDGQYIAEKYGPGLGKVKVGKSSISFKRITDVDLTKLRRLIGKARQTLG